MFRLRRGDFGVSIKNFSGILSGQLEGYASTEFRAHVWAGGIINVRAVGMWVVFKCTRLDEIPKSEGTDREERTGH